MRKKVLILSVLFIFRAEAAVIASGNDCGENCTWTFYDDGTMVISGQGAMHNWDNEVGRWNLPWRNLGITNVVVEDGITNVGMNSFFQCGTIQNITLAPSVEIVGIGAFDEDSLVQSVTMSDSTVWLDQDDFDCYGGTSQISLNCYGDMDICQVNFSNTPKTTIEPTVSCATSDCTHILSDMMHDGYCASLRACKTLDDMKNNGQYCNTYQACQTLVETTTQGQYCNTYETCKTLIDLANAGQYCTNLESCKELSDMASSGEYCSTLADCNSFMNLVDSGYCEGFEACKEMFNADVITYDGKRYASLEDLYNGNALPSITHEEQGDGSFAVFKDGEFVGYKGKRIYTIDEANAVAKPTGNRVSIKYR